MEYGPRRRVKTKTRDICLGNKRETSFWYPEQGEKLSKKKEREREFLKWRTLFFFLKIFSLMRTIFKVFIELVTILLLFYVLVFWPWGTWDLNSPTRDWTCTPSIGRWSLNHWITREVPENYILRENKIYKSSKRPQSKKSSVVIGSWDRESLRIWRFLNIMRAL